MPKRSRHPGPGADEGRRGRYDVFVRFTAPALLLLVALSQIYLAYVQQLLNPDKGGGYGLFSTVDKLTNRHFRVNLGVPNSAGQSGATPVVDQDNVTETLTFKKTLRRAMSLPSETQLRRVAHALGTARYQVPIVAVKVEVWKMTFNPDTAEARRVKLRELELRKADL